MINFIGNTFLTFILTLCCAAVDFNLMVKSREEKLLEDVVRTHDDDVN